MKSQGLTNQKLFPAPESCCKINVYFQTLSDKKAWRGAGGGGGGGERGYITYPRRTGQ